jgi:multisubunit Na+/H+ antiporter MnhB subunit
MRIRRLIAWAAAVVVLLLVFAAYLRPGLALTLATQLWNCF